MSKKCPVCGSKVIKKGKRKGCKFLMSKIGIMDWSRLSDKINKNGEEE